MAIYRRSLHAGADLLALSWCVTAGCGGFPRQESAQELDDLPSSADEVNIRGLPDDAVGSLRRLEQLEFVDLCGGWKQKPLRLTSVGFMRLAALRLPRLRAIRICHVRDLSDDSLRALGRIDTLERVSLEWCSGFGVSGIEGLLRTRIVRLDLTGCAHVDDTWIAALTYYTNLRGLGLSGTSISSAGVERIQAALPYCMIDTSRIEWDRP